MGNQIGNLLKHAKDLLESGRLVDAALAYKQITQIDPENIEALFNWGTIAAKRKNFKNAEVLFLKVLQISPDHMETCFKLGHVYSCMGDPWAAEKICRTGLGRNSQCGDIHALLGEVLRDQGRTAEAIDSFKQALALGYDNGFSIFCYLGIACMDSGDNENAGKYFKKAMDIKPDDLQIHFLFSRVHKYKKDDQHTKTMNSLLDRVDSNNPALPKLLFALAKAAEDIQSYDEAFACYKKANDLVRGSIQYSTKDAVGEFEKTKSFGAGLDKVSYLRLANDEKAKQAKYLQAEQAA